MSNSLFVEAQFKFHGTFQALVIVLSWSPMYRLCIPSRLYKIHLWLITLRRSFDLSFLSVSVGIVTLYAMKI